MRFFEFKPILIENYNGKLNKLKKEFPNQVADIDARVTWAQKVFNNKNQPVMWYLTLYEAWLKSADPAAKSMYDNMLGGFPPFDFSKFEVALNHWLDSAYSERQQIKNIVRQLNVSTTVNDLVNNLKNAEIEIKNEDELTIKNNTPIEILPGDKVVLPVGNFDWWVLPTSQHTPESKVMGHCGTAQHRENQLLSLRNKVPQPVLTFEWNPQSKLLFQMKGKENSKPSKDFHPMIVSLLLSPLVKGFSQYSFQPSSDFSVFDLDEATITTILDNKPNLIIQSVQKNPIDVLRAPLAVRANPQVQKTLHNTNRGIAMLLQPNGEVSTSDEDWTNAVNVAKQHYQLIIQYAPPTITGYMDMMFDALCQDSGYNGNDEPLDDGVSVYKSSPPAIKNNLPLLLRVAEQNYEILDAIPHYKPKLYKPIAEKILKDHPHRISFMDYRGFADDNLYYQYLLQSAKVPPNGAYMITRIPPQFITYELCKLAMVDIPSYLRIENVIKKIPKDNMTPEQYAEIITLADQYK